MRVLLDTCVLSELRNPKGEPGVRRMIHAIACEDLFISVISIGEIVKGVTLLRNSRRKRELQQWTLNLERFYHDRLLTIDLETTHIWGEITAAAQRSGKIIPASDGLIASTAHRHGLYVATRNVSDFEPTGVRIINPWK